MKKIIAICVGFFVFITVGVALIYISATHINRIERTQVADIVYEKTPIKTIDDYYQLSRDVKSLAVSGKDDKQENYYMIYLPDEKAAHLYKNDEGKSKEEITNTFRANHPNRIIEKVNLGWYHDQPTWEITFKNNDNLWGYVLYSFNDGGEVSYIDNI
ncbi:hypothetical protein [Holzapfeliella floricola]|uniref:hypothetical protein n=1 Tax=Holzapfeliella floricola TaxID=679249 RepID=UPI0007051B3E|nr:hypothetical protein [Holzapfeliella floricola]